MDFPDQELSSKVIHAAIKVHQTLGPGFLEAVYEEALCIELDQAGIPYERQKSVPITYCGKSVGDHRLDLFVSNRLVVELKAAKDLDAIHFATVRSYLKATDVESGLLINFASMPLIVKRIGREWFPDRK